MEIRLLFKGITFAAALTAAAGPGLAQSTDAAANADPSAEIARWQQEAEDGAMHAMLELGLAYDLGRGVAQDKITALLWYLRAARAGHPDAQFNVAVMLDAGLALPGQNVQEAAVWYARAATNGHARAQYNLGLLYLSGEGVSRNADLARYWFTEAARSIPAAQDKLAALAPDPEPRRLTAPVVMDGALVDIDGWRLAELVWTAPPGPRDLPFTVELVVPQGDGWSASVLTQTTEASGLVLDLEGMGEAFAWRVLRVDPETSEMASGGWQRLGPSSRPLPDDDRAVAVAGPDPLAETLAQQIQQAMTQ